MYLPYKKVILAGHIIIAVLLTAGSALAQTGDRPKFWAVQSIDTMKYSRDLAREKLNDKSFDAVIDRQIKDIAATGATHVAIATPYDAEFLPILKRWVIAARKYNLSVWFRGNWSGWEEWFGYGKITREDHIRKTEAFILQNKNLFSDGDIFSACPECENGGPGDPRWNGDLKGHRRFMVDEYRATKTVFETIKRNVASNYFSMNGDVALLVMDKDTTEALDGIVVIDHYVKSADRLESDILLLLEKSSGRIMLGEFGAPILDIHGALTPQNQEEWIRTALARLAAIPDVVGVNYWVNVGGSTELWSSRGTAKPAVQALSAGFMPPVIFGYVRDELDKPVTGARVANRYGETLTSGDGSFRLAYFEGIDFELEISGDGYVTRVIEPRTGPEEIINITLLKEKKGIAFRVLVWLRALIGID